MCPIILGLIVDRIKNRESDSFLSNPRPWY
jgi:hypothetical protein